MIRFLDRRQFLAGTAAGAAALAAAPRLRGQADKAPLFQISLAQWSLNRAFFGRNPEKKKTDALLFAEIARKEFGIDAVEYVNQFYKEKKKDDGYVSQLKKVAEDNGVKSVLIMCDGEGALGDPDDKKRMTAVENHRKWLDWAKFLGCHSIRVNAQGVKGTPEEQMDRVVDGYGKLVELGAAMGLGVIVENHGGLSSNGEWLANTTMQKILANGKAAGAAT